MSLFLYEPTGVNPYYLALAQAKDQHLGAPIAISATPSTGGSLTSGTTYYYKITALDGVGGETIASNEISGMPSGGNLSNTLVWNVVPNAFGYNVYRSTTTGTEILLTGSGLPQLQPNPLTGTVTFIDAGTGTTSVTAYNIVASPSGAFIGPHSSVAGFDLTVNPVVMQIGQVWTVAGCGVVGTFSFNQAYTITAISGISIMATATTGNTQAFGLASGGGTITGGGTSPPVSDTTQQTVLFLMPIGMVPISYSNSNIVAYFPASLSALGQVPTGGSGGSGTTGPGISWQGSSTPSGGVAGLVGPLPQMKQFTNRVMIALGNGFAPQMLSDASGTPVNPAFTGAIASVSVSGDQVTVTVAGSVTITTSNLPVGSNVILSGMSDSTYNGVFPVITVTPGAGGSFVIRNVNASGGASTGTFTVSTTPIISTFVPAYDAWQSDSPYALKSIIVPANIPWAPKVAYSAQSAIIPTAANVNGFYFVATAGGTSGATEPTWPSTIGNTVSDGTVTWTCAGSTLYFYTATQGGTSANSTQKGLFGTIVPTTVPAFPQTIGATLTDGSVIWTNSGLVSSSAPPPPGAGHIEVYAGSLWALNTSPTNTANGLDGPCALRMSNTNNPNAWNPVNQAFLDKDDGAEGMGMGKFTITAQGIPPQGSLIAFKYRVPYQIIGVFGASNFAIQPVSSDMGCLAPRSITFVPGYGLMRYSHLGIAVFNGFRDEVISEQIRPYLFPVNDFDSRDIVVADANYLPLSWAAQTANPPMYAFAMPIGNSGGKLTRIMLYDLVLKAWAAPADLPFAIGCMAQVQPVTSNPLTILGGFSDGCLQRWQAGDVNWYTGGGAAVQEVVWSLRTVTVASQNSSQRLWARKMIVRGTGSNSDTDLFSVINVQIRQSGVVQSSVNYKISNQGDFDLFADIGLTGLRFDAIISGDDHLELDGIDWAVEPRPFGVPVSAV
jgi:hypothetical protein